MEEEAPSRRLTGRCFSFSKTGHHLPPSSPFPTPVEMHCVFPKLCFNRSSETNSLEASKY